ncbi:NTF2-like protein [Tilletiaria anomala UBC 951]|uniref:NTF2-like protein n=1 Tax=Tilletiaria anomala (strain ATCC 24038 / CBS 436.72 / UBC 951) TaxID=1037660 RepID=A0A066VB57_TILAU|nr:NTF2-like protein [Tilletiaria anomala UBC 951]KDN38701.1 NTF2-like protein [Tilletiaria anomala UBC 951]
MARPSGPDVESRHLLEFAVKAAETFVSAYYQAADSPQRLQILPTLYLADSSIVWNGNPISGNQEFAALLQQMPSTKHDVQSFDCHPLGGGQQAPNMWQVPSLMLTVSGVVTHHTPDSISAQPVSNAPKAATSTGKGKGKARGGGSAPQNWVDAPIDSLPRAFSQSFVLVNLPQEDGGVNCSGGDNKGGMQPLVGKFFVQADNVRFVG